jgi:DNA-binding XRE family transcriptional regulator
MRLSEMGLEPATLACLRRAGIDVTYRLLDHTCRELIWHSELTPEALYDVLVVLTRQSLALKSTTKSDPRPLTDRDLEIFRLRVVEGRTLKETGQAAGLGTERIRQLLLLHFGLRGTPPAAKARPDRSETRAAPPDCERLGRTIGRLRAAKGLTVDECAATTDLSAEQLARIEDGLRDPTWTTLARLATALGTTAALLIYAIEGEQR